MKKRNSQNPWYSEEGGFFGPEYLEEYNDILTPEATFAEIDFLEKTLSPQKGAKILDCPCGHGRHSVELARRGYNVVGQDLNGFFLEKAKDAANQAGVSVSWHKEDMREVLFEDEFDIVLNLFTSFGYLENDDEDQKTLNAAAKSLKRRGWFVLDVINRDKIIQNYLKRDWLQLSDGSLVLINRQFDHVNGYNIERRTWIGNQKEVSLPLRMYTIPELKAMLCNAGLALEEVYGSYDGDSFTFNSNRCILVAKKN